MFTESIGSLPVLVRSQLTLHSAPCFSILVHEKLSGAAAPGLGLSALAAIGAPMVGAAPPAVAAAAAGAAAAGAAAGAPAAGAAGAALGAAAADGEAGGTDGG